MDADCCYCSLSLTWHGAWLQLRSAFIFRMVALLTTDVSLSSSSFLLPSTRLVKGLYRSHIRPRHFLYTTGVSLLFPPPQVLADVAIRGRHEFQRCDKFFLGWSSHCRFPTSDERLGTNRCLGALRGVQYCCSGDDLPLGSRNSPKNTGRAWLYLWVGDSQNWFCGVWWWS